MEEIVQLETSLPGLRAFRCTTDVLRTGIKEHYVTGRTETGRFEWWARGKVWRSEPGNIQVKEPGDVHRDIAREGTSAFTIVVFAKTDVERLRDSAKVVTTPQLERGDTRAAPFHRLHDAVSRGADRLTLQVALAEAITTFADLKSAPSDHSRPVRRAKEFLREQLAESVSLDELAAHAGLDKFHLCRAFRAQVGIPPHAYLTHLRVQRAKSLLAEGVRATDLAPRVGLYDQSQLTRHFRRIVGTTPGRYSTSKKLDVPHAWTAASNAG